MEQKVEIPDFREIDEAAKENTELAEPTLSSSKSSEDWEKISEDWVSLFLDPNLLDEQPRYPQRGVEGCSQFDTTSLETDDHFSSQELRENSMLLHSIDDCLSHSDLELESSSNIDRDSFDKGHSSPRRAVKMNLAHSKVQPCGHTDTTCYTHSLNQLIGGSTSRIDTNFWRGKECSPNLSMLLNEKFNGDITSSSPTFPSSVIDTERKFTKEICLLPNQDHNVSCFLQCKDQETCLQEGGHEAMASSAEESVPTTPPQLEFFGMQHLYNIGNAIKVGLLGRSREMEISIIEDVKESMKPIDRKVCDANSFGFYNHVVHKDLQSDYNGDDWRRDDGDDSDEKHCTRLIDSLESAQLSRHRIHLYVDELEDKLQTMTTTNAELNVTISHLTAENVNLRRQLGLYYPNPGLYSLRTGMPPIHILPLRPYSGIVARRTMYSGRQMPQVPLAQINTQNSIGSLKRTKCGVMKEEDMKRTKRKVVGVTSTVVGFLFLVMMFGSFEQGLFGFAGRVDNVFHLENAQVGVQGLTSQNENASSLNNSSQWDFTQGWKPLEPGEYGPEREGVPSVYIQVDANNKCTPKDEKSDIEFKKEEANASIPKIDFECSPLQSKDSSLVSLSLDYLSSMKTPVQFGNKMILVITNQSFEPSIIIPSANGFAQADGSLITRDIRASDRIPKKNFGKKNKSILKKGKEMKNASIVGSFESPTMKNDNLAFCESKILTNTSLGPTFETTKPFPKSKDSIVKTNNLILQMLKARSLQQWVSSGLHDPETTFVARELSKKIKSQPNVVLAVNYSRNVGATKKTFYSFTPYDMAPRGPLNSWFFSGLTTEPITWKRNISGAKDEATFLSIKNEGKLESLKTFRDSLQPFTYDQFLQNKAPHSNTCSVPTLSHMFWEATRRTELQQCPATDRPILNKCMCTKLYHLETSAILKKQGSKNKTVAKLVMAKNTQGNPYNFTLAFSRGHVVPQSHEDSFALSVPLIIRPKTSQSQHKNGSDPRTENVVQHQMHSQNMRNGVSSMVVSVLARSEDDEDCKRKGIAKGFSQIFVVVLVDNEKYVTYSCMLPFGRPLARGVAN